MGTQDLALENIRLRRLLRQAGIDPETPVSTAPDDAAGMARRLRQEQAFTRLLIDSLSEGFYATDRHGRTTLCNAAFLRMLGFEREADVLGTLLHDEIHHTHADGTAYPVEDCPIYRTGMDGIPAVVTGEVFFRRDGSSFPVEYRAEPIIRDGELQGTICTFVDITERQDAETRLRESEQRLALALEAAEIGIWDYSPVSGRLEWDDRTRELYGMSPTGVVSFATSMAAVHPADRPRVEKALAEAFDPSGTGGYDVQFRTLGIDDEQERWVAAKGQTTVTGGVVRRFLGAVRDVSEEKRSELHLRLMVNELNHRVKNSLAMVQGVAVQTLKASDNVETARKAFSERLVAIARAHDMLNDTKWERGDLRTIIDVVAERHAAEGKARFDISGPKTLLSPKAVLAFALALHELAINAVKYGALSNADGRVAVFWRLTGVEGQRRLHFEWSERGGPVVVPPQRRGFGSKMIERGLAAELQAEVRIVFDEAGVVCVIDAPYEAA